MKRGSFSIIEIAKLMAVALVYFLTARLGLELAFEHTNASPIWPPAGIAMGLMILMGYRIWPAILLGTLAAEVVFLRSGHLSGLASHIMALVTASGNVLEAAAGAYLLRKFIGGRVVLKKATDVAYFVFFGALIPTTISATVGTTAFCLGTGAFMDYSRWWFTWWVGDAVSVLVITPLLLHWENFAKLRLDGKRSAEIVGLFLGTAILMHYVLYHGFRPYLLILPITIAAVRYGQFKTSAMILVIAVFLTHGTKMGLDPFAGGSTDIALYHLIVFIGVTAIAALVLATVMQQHRRIEAKLRCEEERFRMLYEEAPIPYQSLDATGHIISVNKAWLDALGYEGEDVTGKWIGDFLHESQRDLLRQRFPKFKAFGRITGVEFKFVKRDGSVIDVSVDGNISYDEDHNFKQTHCVFHDITERKRTEEEAALLAAIVRSSDDAIIGKTLDGTITSWNKGAERIYGYAAGEMLGRSISILAPDERKCEIAEIRDALLNGNHIEHLETMRQRKDGRIIPVSITISPLRDGGGNVVGASTIARDISERKRIEEALRASEQNYRSLFEESLDCILVTSPEGRILDINKIGVQLFGYSSKEEMAGLLIGRDLYQDPKRRGSILRQVDQTGGAEFELMMKRKNGEEFLAHCLMYATRDGSGRVTSYRGTMQDITDRKRAEDSLRQANQDWERTFDAVSDFIFVQDADGHIVRANKAMCDRLGKAQEDLTGMHCYEVMHDRKAPAAKCPRLLMLDDWHGHGGEIADSPLGGCLAVNVSPIRDSQGNLVGSVHVARDITETRRLQELEARAQRLDTAGQIAGQVAHDLNNLLAPIAAYPELIREMLPADNPVLEYVDIIEKAGARIADINQQLLTLSRRGHYSQDIVNVNSLLAQAAKDAGQPSDNIACSFDLAEDLMNIKGGSAQLHRVFVNLFVNARDAISDRGEINVRTENVYIDETSVKYNRVPRGEYVKVTIGDTGSGIPPEVIERIFDPFFTTKTADKKRGSGLGLSVVDAVIKDHGGYLDLTSEVGKGTSFYLYFPVTHESNVVETDISMPRGTEEILVVDDDDVQRGVLKKLLTSLGYHVAVCDGGEKALEQIQRHEYDLLVLDMIMPDGMSGVETYREVLKFQPNQRAIIVSGFSETERVREAQALGAGAFIKKPLNRMTIARAVREELDRKASSSKFVSV